MENFKSLYLEYCKTYGVEPQEAVKEELKRLAMSRADEGGARALNLSSNHLTNKTCMVLGKLLAHDQNITSLLLNDCTLNSDGINSLCLALNTNNCIRTLELKGNNIHGEATEALAKLLRQNSAIKSLSLEWNSLGLMDTYAFAHFCESLGMNRSLKDLDLRNNQITHTSALELCAAIEANATLQSLDLRWNSIGLVGGKALLNALKKNKTLTVLHIAGNNIPDELGDSINLKIAHNNDNFKTAKEFSNRTAVLSNELDAVHFQKEKQINLLLSKIDLQEEAVRKTNRTMSEKMKKLQNVLEDRMSTMNAMQSKLSIAEADLALSEQKCADLSHALDKLKMEKDTDLQLVSAKARRDKEELLSEKLKVDRELKDMVQRYNQVEEKFKDVERKCQELQLASYEAKERLAQGQAEYQIKMVMLDEEARRLKQKQRDEIKELEASKAKELERAKDDFEQTERSLRERVNKMEAVKHSLEDEIARLKSAMAAEKLAHEQELHELRVKTQLEDTNKRREMEDRVKTLQTSKDDLIAENAKLGAKVVDLQQKISSQSLEIETLKRNNDSLRNQLHEKEMELLQDHDKLKSDYEKRIRAVQKDIDRIDAYKESIHDMEIKIKKLEADNQISLRNAQIENESLKGRLRNLEDIVERVKEEEETRKKKGEDFIKECFRPSVVLTAKKQ